ncbi:MAG TPA: hypothetical protein VKC61_19025 [Pyrinomonadaceae bacterium]|nr:hypothetical protein [Pyrinomonadaceae bacterium]
MGLNADLTTKLDAGSLVQGFLAGIAGPAGSLNTIESPADSGQLAGASTSGNSFLPEPIRAALARFGNVRIGPVQAIPTLDRIQETLTSIEQLTSRNLNTDISALAEQLSRELETGGADGIPGTLLRVVNLLKEAPAGSALANLLSTITSGSSSLSLPPEVKNFLPGLVSTGRVIAGLMIFETVLSEGDRLSRLVAAQFSAERARQELANLNGSFQVGGGTLSQLLTGVDVNDAARLEGAIVAAETAAEKLEAFDEYLSAGMGFGEATLEYFDVKTAQTELAVAATLLRDTDLGDLKKLIEAAAGWLRPIADQLDVSGAPARGLEGLLTLAESQVTRAATAIRGLDASILVDPLTTGLNEIMRPLRDFTDLVSQLVVEIRAALEQVRDTVAALPVGDIAGAIRTALAPVTEAMNALRALVETISAALEAAAGEAVEALGQVEGKVDEFEAQIRALFQEAKEFVDGLHLDQVIGQIGDKVNEFVAVLEQAQMKPYFDTASDAIGGAADVISAVPLNLLPDSMKADLETALKPIREVDAEAVETEIEGLLQISPGGEFQLRAQLETALEDVQAKFDEVITTLEENHPRKFLQQIDEKLSEIAQKIQELSPQLALEPVQEAITNLKASLNSFDLERELQPIQQVFDQAITTLNQYSPAALLQPLQERVRSARENLIDVIKLNEWRALLDSLSGLTSSQLDVLDPAQLEELIRVGLQTLRTELAQLPNPGIGKWLGMIIMGVMRGSGLRISPASIDAVMGWLQAEGSGSADLSARAASIAGALAQAKTEIESFDVAGLAAAVIQPINSLKPVISELAGRLEPASGQRVRLEAVLIRLAPEAIIGGLTANRARYLALVDTAAGFGDSLRRTGMSEVDLAIASLRDAFSPLNPILAKARELGAFMGLSGFDGGFGGVLTNALQVLSPERISGLATTLLTALKDRLRTIIDQVLGPIKAAVEDLERLIGLIDLQPVIDGVNAVFQEVLAQIQAFSPLTLLGDQLTAFRDLKAQLLAFDPLTAILTLLNTLRDTSARVLAKLSAERLLEAPLQIYDTILNAISQLDIERLLAPLLDLLDNIAKQVDEGLDETVAAFQRLQDSLPAPGGGGSASASIGVG